MRHCKPLTLTCGLLIAFAGQIAIANAKPSEPTEPVPAANPGTWANAEDYPPEALGAEAEGVTRFTLSVDQFGKVTACRVTEPSGSEALDRRTCDLMLRNAAFTPARGSDGKPVKGEWSSSLRWRIPEAMPLLKDSRAVLSFQVAADGSVNNCVVERSDGEALASGLKIGPSDRCPTKKFESGYANAAGEPVAKTVRMTQIIEVIDTER